jgi:hypothetical protein
MDLMQSIAVNRAGHDKANPDSVEPGRTGEAKIKQSIIKRHISNYINKLLTSTYRQLKRLEATDPLRFSDLNSKGHYSP